MFNVRIMGIVALKYHLPSTEKNKIGEIPDLLTLVVCILLAFCKYWLILEQYPVYVCTQWYNRCAVYISAIHYGETLNGSTGYLPLTSFNERKTCKTYNL